MFSSLVFSWKASKIVLNTSELAPKYVYRMFSVMIFLKSILKRAETSILDRVLRNRVLYYAPVLPCGRLINHWTSAASYQGCTAASDLQQLHGQRLQTREILYIVWGKASLPRSFTVLPMPGFLSPVLTIGLGNACLFVSHNMQYFISLLKVMLFNWLIVQRWQARFSSGNFWILRRCSTLTL